MAKTIAFTYVDDDGEEQEAELPGRNEVCGRCGGEGKHTNPSIDGNGITSSEWAEWDDEERETYLSGGYDVTCEECHGNRVVVEVDEDACDKALLEKYREAERERAMCDAIQRSELRAERGWEW